MTNVSDILKNPIRKMGKEIFNNLLNKHLLSGAQHARWWVPTEQETRREIELQKSITVLGGNSLKGHTGKSRQDASRERHSLRYMPFLGSSLVAQTIKNPPAVRDTCAQSLSWEDPLRRAWQPTQAFLPGESPWMEKPGKLQPIRLQRVGHN